LATPDAPPSNVLSLHVPRARRGSKKFLRAMKLPHFMVRFFRLQEKNGRLSAGFGGGDG